MTASFKYLEKQDESGSSDSTILREVQSALYNLRFGSVEVIVHNGQVVQIERKEKFRFQNSKSV